MQHLGYIRKLFFLDLDNSFSSSGGKVAVWAEKVVDQWNEANFRGFKDQNKEINVSAILFIY